MNAIQVLVWQGLMSRVLPSHPDTAVQCRAGFAGLQIFFVGCYIVWSAVFKRKTGLLAIPHRMQVGDEWGFV